MYVAKLVVPTEKQLVDANRAEDDGPQPLEGDQENDVPLVPGDSYTVLLMARGRCKCIVQVSGQIEPTIKNVVRGIDFNLYLFFRQAHCKHRRRFFFPRIV
jgi:hypothetical protein